jgi:hypothetical protein
MRVACSRASGSARKAKARAVAGSRYRRALHLLGLALAIVVVANGALSRSWLASLDSRPVRGVRLGMSPESARAAFADDSAGDWSSPPGCCGTTLEWSRANANATQTRWARFEFHQGFLVAIRVLSDASPPTRQVEVTPVAVAETRPGADGSTSTTVLARGCKMHGAEVRQLLAAAGDHSN